MVSCRTVRINLLLLIIQCIFLLTYSWSCRPVWSHAKITAAATTTDASTQSTEIGTSFDFQENVDTNRNENAQADQRYYYALRGRLLKQVRKTCLDYNMIAQGDHIMVCVSGGKDSATLLDLLLSMQKTMKQQHLLHFELTVVHVDQKQPGYNGTPLTEWLQQLQVNYKVVQEDTYSVVVDKTAAGKSFCTLCSRLRRGILYSTAMELGCNKIALGHHADDCLETLMLNMIHAGQIKAMPARYTSQRGSLAVMRPLIACMEKDIAEYAALSQFPILPCNLCSNQADLQRPQVKLLLSTLSSLNPTAKQNMLRACQNVKASHLLDQELRRACGMDPITGETELNEDETI